MKSTHKYTVSIYREEPSGEEREITCEFAIIHGRRGSRGPFGEPLEPDDPDEEELVEAYYTDSGEEVELTDDEYVAAVEKLY